MNRYLASVLAAWCIAGVSGLAERGPILFEFLASNHTTLTDLGHAGWHTMASEFKPQYPPQRTGVSYGMLGGQAVYFSKPSSRAPNRSDTVEGIDEVRFSHPRGFYDQPFLLAIHTETPGAPTDVAE